MAEIPLPSFDTLAKVAGWIGQQSRTWLAMVRNPIEFLCTINLSSTDSLANASKFVIFVLLAILLIELPIDSQIWHINPFDAAAAITGLVLKVIGILLFSYSLHVSASFLRGKGSLTSTFVAMFYATAFIPFLTLIKYVSRIDPALRDMMFGKNILSLHLSPESWAYFAFATALELAVTIFIIVKLIPVIRFVHHFGSFRALVAIITAGIVHNLYSLFVAAPIFLMIVTNANPVHH